MQRTLESLAPWSTDRELGHGGDAFPVGAHELAVRQSVQCGLDSPLRGSGPYGDLRGSRRELVRALVEVGTPTRPLR